MKSLGILIFSVSLLSAPLGWGQNLKSALDGRLYLRAGERVLEVSELQKMYSQNGESSLWVNDHQPNTAALALRDLLIKAENYGLTSSVYWTPIHEKLFQQLTKTTSLTFEFLLTDSYVRFARDLSTGQLSSPDLIDEDIKLTGKGFELHGKLIELAQKPEGLKQGLELLAPQAPQYQRLLELLRKFRTLEDEKAWGDLTDPGADIKPGQSHVSIPEMKKRMRDLGYSISNHSAEFDSEMQEAYRNFQLHNRLPVVKNLSRTIYRSLMPNLSERILQVRANLEKFRWFPRAWEGEHLFVNLAFQEAEIFQNGDRVLMMKTVNGRPTRRTPTMKDEIRFVELNPTWTVPFSIAVKDKLPLLRENPRALEDLEIWTYQNEDRIDPTRISWHDVDRGNFDFTFVQQPGPQNALGLVKFPLTNPWFIYLHDTNEKFKMKEWNRQLSSGCVRLERPFDLALYVLRDKPEWSLSNLESKEQSQFRIKTTKPLPVYMMYQTVAVGEQGQVRSAFDDYGQDRRLIELFKTRESHEKF